MFTRIEIKNFQSHEDTVIDFNKGINSICGESDNGKTAVIRAIRWVVENRPLGTDTLLSNWAHDAKGKQTDDMSVKLYTENGWIQRIRTKDKNGYTLFIDGKETKLEAVGTDVPKEVTDFLKVNDINFQYQFDQPYLISMSAGEASKYLNNIIHLDSIDSILTVAEGNKRTISSEQKIVDNDISELERELKNTEWVDEAENIYKRMVKYDEAVKNKTDEMSGLSGEISDRECIKIVDLTESQKLIEEIETIEIPDISELESEISQYEQLNEKTVDMSRQKIIINKIEQIELQDISELESEISLYEMENEKILILSKEINELRKSMGDICPYCGGKLKEGFELCS